MSIFTSERFASSAASGADWRDASKAVLKAFEGSKTSDRSFNFGFLYISDRLADDANSILNLFKSVLNIDNWVGTIGIGVCAVGQSFIDKPAISALIGYFDPEDFCLFPSMATDISETVATLQPWLDHNDPMLVLAHGDPMADEDPAVIIKKLETLTSGFLVGGMSSSRREHFQFAGDIFQGGVSGVAFSQDIKLASTLSQGCKPIGKKHVITQGSDHVIKKLDSKNAVDVFEDDLRDMALKKIDDKGIVPDELKSLFKGDVNIAFPISGTDVDDFLVRNILGIKEDGSILVSQNVMNGENIIFVHRDNKTLQQDLSTKLLELRERVKQETGEFNPKGALYISCVARSFPDFLGNKDKSNNNKENDEMALIQEIIGDVPLTGFYAGGEICNARLYGYTGILTLFL